MRRGEGDDLWFIARKKDIIIRGGTNISPVEVEEALVACHPAVEEAAVVGTPDAVLGQRVFGFVKLAAGDEEDVVAEILRNVAKRLAPYKVPEDLQVLGALPRNALGKVDRKKLQAMVCGDRRRVLNRPSSDRLSVRRIVWKEHSPRQRVTQVTAIETDASPQR